MPLRRLPRTTATAAAAVRTDFSDKKRGFLVRGSLFFCWFFTADGSLPRQRLATVGLSLFAAKKRRKNRHRFEAVDADQGCGPGPGECGHLTTAYSGLGGLSKEGFKWHNRKAIGGTEERNRARYNLAGCLLPVAVTGKWFLITSLFTGPQAGE